MDLRNRLSAVLAGSSAQNAHLSQSSPDHAAIAPEAVTADDAAGLLGQGYNSLIPDFLPQRAVVPKTKSVPDNAFVLQVQEVIGTESLKTKLSEGITIGASYGAVSMAANYSRTLEDEVNAFNLCFAIYIYYRTSKVYVTSAEATIEVLEYVGSPDKFFACYGDSYITEVGLGGFIVGFVKYDVYSVSHKEEVRKSLRAAVNTLVASGSVSGEQTQALDTLRQYNSTSFGFSGQGFGFIPQSLQDLQNHLPSISNDVRDSPLYYRHTSYSSVPKLPITFNIDKAIKAKNKILELRDKFILSRNTLILLQSYPHVFEGADKYNANQLLATVEGQLTDLDTMLEEVSSDPFSQREPKEMPKLPTVPNPFNIGIEVKVWDDHGIAYEGQAGIPVGSPTAPIWKIAVKILRDGISVNYSGHRVGDPERFESSRDGGVLFESAPPLNLCDLNMVLEGPASPGWSIVYECWGLDAGHDYAELRDGQWASFWSKHDIPVTRVAVRLEPNFGSVRRPAMREASDVTR